MVSEIKDENASLSRLAFVQQVSFISAELGFLCKKAVSLDVH